MNKQDYQEFMNYYNSVKDTLDEASSEVKTQFVLAIAELINNRLAPIVIHHSLRNGETFLDRPVFKGSTETRQDEFFVSDEDKELLKIIQDSMQNCALHLAFVDYLTDAANGNVIVKYDSVKQLQKERMQVIIGVYADYDPEEDKSYLVPSVHIETDRVLLAL